MNIPGSVHIVGSRHGYSLYPWTKVQFLWPCEVQWHLIGASTIKQSNMSWLLFYSIIKLEMPDCLYIYITYLYLTHTYAYIHIYIYVHHICVYRERRQIDRQGDREVHSERQEQTETERQRESFAPRKQGLGSASTACVESYHPSCVPSRLRLPSVSVTLL